MWFRLRPLRFVLEPEETIAFPNGLAGNVIRGALGSVADKQHALHSQFFPTVGVAPFVLRVRHLDGCRIAAREKFEVGINLFRADLAALAYLTETIGRWQHTGLGEKRVSAPLVRVDGAEPLRFFLGAQPGEQLAGLRVHFLTPTELKSGGELVARPEFNVLFARLYARIRKLSDLREEGPLLRDERLLQLAESVQCVRCDTEHVAATRYSSRTGQTHPLGGFIGTADYEGDMTEFLPFLQLGKWIGVGRQTVWGKGEIDVEYIL